MRVSENKLQTPNTSLDAESKEILKATAQRIAGGDTMMVSKRVMLSLISEIEWLENQLSGIVTSD